MFSKYVVAIFVSMKMTSGYLTYLQELPVLVPSTAVGNSGKGELAWGGAVGKGAHLGLWVSV